MAIAKKCDRCGDLYEQYNEDNGASNGVATIFINEDCSNFMTNATCDLCKRCWAEFDKWLKNPAMMVILPTSIIGIKNDDDWKNRPQPEQYKITCDNSFMKSFEEDE